MVEESAIHGGALERDGRVSEMRTLRVRLLGNVTWIWLCFVFHQRIWRITSAIQSTWREATVIVN